MILRGGLRDIMRNSRAAKRHPGGLRERSVYGVML
jgi:hypothetical protein